MKKTMIRTFAAMLALLLLCSMPFAAGAATKTLTLDTAVTLEYDGRASREDIFTFTPAETGSYVFYSAGEVDVYCTLYDADEVEINYADDELGYPNFRLYYDLVAGETYTFAVGNFVGIEGESIVCLKKATAATSIVLNLGERYSGYVGTSAHLDAALMPENAIDEDISFATTDKDTVSIDEDGNVELLAVGEATLSATTESGLSASCVVTVLEAESIAVGESKTVDTNIALHGIAYKFTAAENARVAVYTQGTVESVIRVSDDALSSIDVVLDTYYENNAKVVFDVEAGKSYYLLVYGDNWQSGAETFTLHLEKTVKPTSMILDAPATYYGYAEEVFYPTLRFAPMNADEPAYTITSSKPSVVEVEGDAIYMIKEGTATITVQAGSFKKTFKATVLAPDAMKENSYTEAAPRNDMGYQLFTFKPSKSANYIFGTTGCKEAVYGNIYSATTDMMPEEVYYNETATGFTACYALTKGKTYHFAVGVFHYQEITPFRVYVYREGAAGCAEGEHSWNAGAITKMPTTKAEGIRTTLCSVCGLTKTATVKKLTSSADTSKVFKDIKKGDWFYKSGAIDFVYNAGLFKGITETSFEPQTNMTRGMFVTVLGRLAGVDVKKTESKFTDVPKSQYYSGYVKWASDNGIVNGTSATTFAPDANVTREQICKMMVEYCNYAGITLRQINKPITFKDAGKISAWAKEYVATCQTAGLVNGSQDGNGYVFNPQGNATRAEVATIINNFAKNYL